MQSIGNLLNDQLINLSVIIVNYNLPRITKECIESVRLSNFSPLNIIVIENGSEDGSVELLTRTYPDIDLIRLHKNLGFVGGYNRGIEEALVDNASHILLLNNDTTIEEDTIRALVTADWDIAVPKILFHHKPQIIQTAGAKWRSFPPSVVLRGLNHKDNGQFDSPVQLQYASACAMLVRREVFESIGGFDPDYQNYVEDFDFCYRANQKGFRIGYVPEARVYHRDSQTAGKDPKRRRRLIGRNTVVFYRKNNRFPLLYLYIFIIWLIIRETIKGNISHLQDYWQGIMEGFRFIRSRLTS